MEDVPTTCDPTTPAWMCITGAEIQFVLPFILVAVFIVGVVLLIKNDQRRHNGPKQNKGVDPGQGSSIISAIYNHRPNGTNTLTTKTYTHTKDPQKHAHAMMPHHPKK